MELLVSLVPARAVAQPIAQYELLLFEEPMVTAAAKHEQSLREAPADVTIITRTDIQRFGYRTLAEALAAVRGFYPSYDRNYSYIGVRGFLRPRDYNNRILLLVNGHAYNDDVYGAAQLGNEFGIDMEAIERIEVVRGPGSALYGGNAVFAVVNVVTARAYELPGVRPLVETGSFGRKRGQVSVGHVFGNGIEMLSSASVLDIDGHDELFYPAYDAPETNNGIARDADGERAVNFFLSTRWNDLMFQAGANRRDKHVPTGSFGTTFNDPDTKTIDGRQFAELQYTTEIRSDLRLSTRAFYDGLRYDGTYIYGSGADRVKNRDHASSHWFGAEVQGRWQVWPANAVTLGADFTYHPGATQKQFDDPGETIFDTTQAFDAWGIFVQDEWRLARHLSLAAGLRFDRYYGRLQDVSPRAALIWEPRTDTTVKLMVGRAFRPPSLWEQFSADQSVGYRGNPQLDPEHLMAYEGVLQQELWCDARALLSVYHYEIDGLIDQAPVVDPTTGETVSELANLTSVHATGAEIGLRVPLPHGMEARGGYAIQQARQAGGQLLTNSPKHVGHAALLFPLPWEVEGGAQLRVVGPRNTLAGNQVGTAAVADLTLNYRTPLPGLNAGVGLYNVFDQEYADPAGPEHQQDEIPQDGFTFRVQLQYVF